MAFNIGFSSSPHGLIRPCTTPAERQPTALSIADIRRPFTAFPSTGFDAELERLDSEDPMIRQMAMNNLIAIAKHGGSTERIVSVMMEKLKDRDKFFRGLAVDALSRSAKQVRQEVTTALIESLNDPDANVRCRAVQALRPACIGQTHSQVVAALCILLEDENPYVQDAAVDNIQYAITQASFEVREELLASVHKGIRAAAILSFLDEILKGGEEAMQIVINMLEDKEFEVRMEAVGVISKVLTTQDTKAVQECMTRLKAECKELHEVERPKAKGLMIDKALGALMAALEDPDPDIRTAVLRSLSCNTAIGNQKVFTAVLVLLADEVEGTRNLARQWVSNVVAATQKERKEWAYTIVIDLLTSCSGLTQLSAAWVVAKVMANGNTKYLKDITPLLEHEHALTRVAGLWALEEAVKNVVPSIMWSSSGAPTVPRALGDQDRRCIFSRIFGVGRATAERRYLQMPPGYNLPWARGRQSAAAARHQGRSQSGREFFWVFGRTASGGALAPELLRATRSQPESIQTVHLFLFFSFSEHPGVGPLEFLRNLSKTTLFIDFL